MELPLRTRSNRLGGENTAVGCHVGGLGTYSGVASSNRAGSTCSAFLTMACLVPTVGVPTAL